MTPETSPTLIRLHKHLAAAGVASRRQCEELMAEGRVTVDGREVRDLGFVLDPTEHEVRVDGELVAEQPKHYYLLNKPVGYVCTHRDPAGRPQAVDLVPIPGLALFTVGRLDESSEGLLLVTNDGAMSNRLAHPRYRIRRTYHVEVAGRPDAEALSLLRKGMYFEEGHFHMQDARILKTQGKNTLLEVVLTEGKNREIRRLFARVGHKVLALQRVAFGPIRLGRLPPGEFRPLTPRELAELTKLTTGRARSDSPQKAPPTRSPAAKAGATSRKRAQRHKGDAARRGGRPRSRRGQGRP